jgi:hypothetical protein
MPVHTAGRLDLGTLHSPHRGAFTLIEVVVVLSMLVVVLLTTYQILNNCLQTEKEVTRTQQPEKVGEAIISLVRRDLSGAFFKGVSTQLNHQVFLGIEGGGPTDPQDQVYFLSSVEPSPREDLEEHEAIRSATVIGYFLQPSRASTKYPCQTLFRKEIVDFSGASPLEAPGMNYAVYDKVKSLSFEFFDGYEWLYDWSSEREVAAREDEIAAQAEQESRQQKRIARVSDPTEAEEELDQGPVYKSPLPVAVRIEVEIYAGEGSEVFEVQGQPVVRKFSSIVPLIASKWLPIELEEDADAAALAAEDSGEGADGVGGRSRTSGANVGLSELRGPRGRGPGREGGPGGPRGGPGGRGAPGLRGAGGPPGGPPGGRRAGPTAGAPTRGGLSTGTRGGGGARSSPRR